jgi:hypothetical protein
MLMIRYVANVHWKRIALRDACRLQMCIYSSKECVEFVVKIRLVFPPGCANAGKLKWFDIIVAADVVRSLANKRISACTHMV